MLTTKEAIEKRRSIRKFKPDPISPNIIEELLESARLAPSGCNAQPWRFKVVTGQTTKTKLAEAAFNQKFIATAPAILVCCANLKEYIDNMALRVQELKNINAINSDIADNLAKRAVTYKSLPLQQLEMTTGFNVAIAIEHIVLRALDFGLGTCWIKLLDAKKISELFGWDENIAVISLLPIGYPAEDPKPRQRKQINELLL